MAKIVFKELTSNQNVPFPASFIRRVTFIHMKKDHMKNGQLKPTYKYRLLQRSSSLQIRKFIGKPEIRQLLFLF